MGFRLLLWMLAVRLRWLGKHDAAFREKLQKRQVVMQWRTFAGKPARWFHLQTSGVTSASGQHKDPSVTLNFKDASYAFATLRAAGKNQMIFMEGMQKQDIRIEGDAAQLMWFMTLMKHIVPSKKK